MLLLSVLRGLVIKWAESDSDAAPPDWLLRYADVCWHMLTYADVC